MTISPAPPITRFIFFSLFSILLLAPMSGLRAQDCICTNCPQFMPDNFVGDFLINVQGATNNTLGQNGQGVCGVNISFDHEYLGDLSIVLTSPSGQSVTLVGPIGLFGGTDFTTWNVSFVPCGDVANPDAGFAAQWNNNQTWGLFGNYTGSYYPNNGCLENFNSGPVNGTWTLTVTDGQAVDVGNFYDYEIIFCDPSGISCFSCAAEAGNLTQNDVTACQGSANLNLNLPPTYPAPLVAPPVSDYSYTYVVGGAGGVIVAYEPGPDLSGYDPGTYTICGISYLTSQENLLPQPDGGLTVTQLTNQLASSTPPLCGDVSGNCVNVTINASPPDEEEYVTICAPMCYEFHNQTYCQTGTYARNLLSNQGCSYTAILFLEVLQPTTRNIIETICAGECSTIPGFESYCGQGNYTEHFTNAVGCDSIVNLNLQVLNVVSNISTPVDLTCSQPTQQLLGVGSTIGAGVNYQWTASNGGHIVGGTNSINALIDEPGNYQLRVCKTAGGATCCDSTEVTVLSNETPPAAPALIVGTNTICQGQTVTYTSTTVTDATSYIWTVPPGVTINSGQNTQTINVTWNSATGGNVCAAASNICGTSLPTCQAVTVTPPVAPTPPVGAYSICAGTTENYTIPPVAGATNYTWSLTGGGTITSGQGTTAIVVNWGNNNGTVCVNATGACGTSLDVCLPVTVTVIPPSPTITGNLNSCPGLTATYTVASILGASSYNWQVTNGSITSGQGTTTVQVTWNTNATSGTICVNAANSCGNSTDACQMVNLSIPLAGQITTICDPTNQFYTVSFPISGGTTPYSISGGTITSGVFTSDQIASGMPYNFSILDANTCVSANIMGSFNCSCSTDAGTMSLAPLAACEGQTVTATHQGGQNLDGNDVAAYLLHTNSGTSLGTILAQNTTGTFGVTSGMAYETTYYISYVVGNNVAGVPDLSDPCLSVSQGQPVIFHQNPVANAGIDADTCGLALTLFGNTGIGAGTWAIISTPVGGVLNLSGVQNPNSTASASIYGDYILSWMLDNSGCTDTDSIILSFNDSPSAINLINTCDAANENYTVSFSITGGAPNYSTTGTPPGLMTSSLFVSDPIPNGGNYAYLVTDSTGCISPPITGTFSCNCATNAGTMDIGALSTCEGGTISAVHLGGENLDGNDIAGYFLHTGSAGSLGTVFAENSTGVFGFQNGMTYGTTYYVSYVVGNDLNGVPDTTDFCLSVSSGQPIVFYQNPVADAGLDVDTCGTVLNLNGNNLLNASGQWTVTSGNQSNINIVESINPLSSVSSTQAGAYTLAWTITQNGCIGTDQVTLQFNDSPILTDLVRTCDAANENFTVTLTLNGGTAPYSVNGTPVPGTNFTSAPFVNGQSYTFNVSDANGCNMPAIIGAFSCNCATNAGTMPLQTISVCEGLSLSATANNNQSLDANDIVAYVLHNGAGPALGQVYAQNTTGTFTLQNGMNLGETYYISLVAGNPLGNFPDPLDPCFSVATGQPVVWLQDPIPNAGADNELCGETINLQGVGTGFNGLWTQVTGPGTASFISSNDPISEVTVSLNGTYIFQWTETNGVCTGSDQVIIDFNQNPGLTGLAEICNGTNTQYVVTFSATGGTPPYSVLGLAGAFTGSVYNSLPVANGSSYSFGLVDANGCPSGNVSGVQNCLCSTDAGSMQTTPLTFCADTPASGIWNNDGNTDADDIIQYILHSDPGSSLGTIFATNSQPVFNFGGSLQTNVTYYISAIAGSNVAGSVNLTDPCLSIAPGVPVQWKPMPAASLTGDATLCQGDGAVLAFSGTGTYPLTVTYLDGASQNSLVLTSAQTVTINLTPSSTSVYSLISVADATAPTCSTALNDMVTISVNQPVDAGTANEPVELCAGVDLPIALSNLITGADLGGLWTETSPVHSLPGAFNAATGTFQTTTQPAGTYTFKYLLTAAAPCTNDEETVTIIIAPLPIADAGENQAINCDQTSVTLGGLSTSAGTYSWMLDGTNVGATKQIIVAEPGTYALMVTNPAGCTDEDETVVMLDNQQPIAEELTINGVRCFGESNGVISVDAVTAAHYPVQYAINGATFQSSPIFSGLEEGNYTITLMDANGCESTTAVLYVTEPPLLTADLGADIEAALSDSVHLRVETLPLDELDTIVWSPLLDTSSVRRANEQNFVPLQSWRVQVMVQDSNGCIATDEVLIRLDKPRNIFIPNIFNPQSGRDPVLYIFGGKDVAEIETFLIFDRWGTLLFEQKNFQPNDPSKGWDGKYKGELLNPAVVVYQASVRFIDGQKILYKGDVTLIR